MSKPKTIGEELPSLRKRLTYSLLKAAASYAAKAELTMGELTELLQLAYFEELRKQHPNELTSIAEHLGLSLRSISSLNNRLKKTFFAAETKILPARRVAASLQGGPMSKAELEKKLPDLGQQTIKEALGFLEKNSWVKREGKRFEVSTALRNYVNSDITRRIDGLNNQMSILANSVWHRFMDNNPNAIGRSWAFQALPEKVEEFLQQTVKTLRHTAVDLEEETLSAGGGQRFGITLAFAPLEDEQ